MMLDFEYVSSSELAVLDLDDEVSTSTAVSKEVVEIMQIEMDDSDVQVLLLEDVSLLLVLVEIIIDNFVLPDESGRQIRKDLLPPSSVVSG